MRVGLGDPLALFKREKEESIPCERRRPLRDGTTSVDYILSILQSVSGVLPSLEVLTFVCWESRDSSQFPMKFSMRQRWKAADDAFREASLPALRKVYIEVRWRRGEMDPLDLIHGEVSYLRSKKDLLELTGSHY